MKALHALMRTYAYLYFLVVAGFLAGLALVAYISRVHNINSGGMTAMAGETLSRGLLAIGLGGIILVALAALGRLQWLFALYTVFAVVTMFRWFFASGYNFGSQEAFRGAVLLFIGAVGAMLCSFTGLGKRHRQPKRSKRR